MTCRFDGVLILVRHAMPQVVPGVPPDRWELGEDGRRAARALAKQLDRPAYHVASDEPKARQTIEELAGAAEIRTDPGFREVGRPSDWVPNHRELARQYVAGVCHSGWEAHDQVIARFDAAVSRHTASAGGKTLIIGTHGMVPTVWLASGVPLTPSPEDFWEQLRFPDLIEVDLPRRRARRLLDSPQ